MSGEAKKDAIRERLELLANTGPLTPQAVVDDARKKTSPLHNEFEWDDKKAGHHWRLQQARRLIASVTLTVINEERIISTVAYVRDPEAAGNEQGYVRTVDLQSDKGRALAAIMGEVGRIEAHLIRTRSLASALDLDDEVAEMLVKLADFRRAAMLAVVA